MLGGGMRSPSPVRVALVGLEEGLCASPNANVGPEEGVRAIPQIRHRLRGQP